MKRNIFLVFLILLGLSCKEKSQQPANNSEVSISEPLSYSEKFRPQFHFSPPAKWMNDPNGLVYHQGYYHLFYQYYPDDIVWGPMHWGHAMSKDLIRWENKPIALYPDEHGLIFSGSAVIDKQNSSGFGTKENPPLVAIFTYHLMEGEKAGRKDFQTQGIAYSLDNGITWTKYEGNPVIGNTDIKDFRDPKVDWHDESERWIMTLVAGDHAKFYASDNLKDWELISEFGKDIGAHGGVWECPDFFKLPVAGTSEEKWVLLISINPGAPNGGSGTQYFVGEFDGTQFTTKQTQNKWLDHGRDNYAGVTYNNTPNEDRIFIGWMSNWDYARDTPTQVWRSAMTVPRKLTLHRDGDSYYLKNYPLTNFSTITSELEQHEKISLATPLQIQKENFNQSEIRFDANLSAALKVNLRNEGGENITFEMNPVSKQLSFDRTGSGQTQFAEKFAPSLQKQPYHPKDEIVEIRLLIDASSVEVFVDKGRYVFTNQIFPENPYTTLEITGASTSTLNALTINQLTSIWNNE